MRVKKILVHMLAAVMLLAGGVADARPGVPFTPGNVNIIHGVSYTHHSRGVSGFADEAVTVLEIEPNANARIIAGVPRYNYVQGYRTVSYMAGAYTAQGYDVIAAINGSFFGLLSPAGAQVPNQGLFIHDGELLRPWNHGASNEYISQEHYIVGVMRNGAFFHAYNPLHTMWLSVNGGEPRELQGLNSPRSVGQPRWQDLNLLTERFDNTVRAADERLEGTDVRLEVVAGRMSFGEELVVRVARRAAPAENNAPIAAGQAILTASSVTDKSFLNTLNEGDIIRVSNSFENRRGSLVNWAQVEQAVPAHFALISGGRRRPLPAEPGALVPQYPQITPNPNTSGTLSLLPAQNARRPRTAVGLRGDGTLVWVVASGGANAGMTMREFQDYLISLGLGYAWNFDGGGSSAMVIGETPVTYADGRDSRFQRPVANGLVLVNRQPAHIPFIDIYAGHWFAGYVMFAYNNGLISGTSASPMIFSPNEPITRATLVAMLYRHAGSPSIAGIANPFNDISAQRYADAVIWAAHNNIVHGVGQGRFAPDQSITREQLAVIMVRYANMAGKRLPDGRQLDFADTASISGWARDAVSAMQASGIITGRADNRFAPHGSVTRAEATAIMRRFIES